jgi:ribosomal protein L35
MVKKGRQSMEQARSVSTEILTNFTDYSSIEAEPKSEGKEFQLLLNQMARQKNKQNSEERIRLSNPRGNRKPKLRYKQSHQGHLKTKRSSRSKRRQLSNAIVGSTNDRKIRRKIVNI